jgi:hypothetical protein
MSNPQDPSKLPNQPVNPQGLPEEFSKAENEAFTKAAEEVDWLNRLLQNPDFIRYQLAQSARRNEEGENALNVANDDRNARSFIVAHAVMRRECGWAEGLLARNLAVIEDRKNRAAEMQKRREIQLDRVVNPNAQTPSAL